MHHQYFRVRLEHASVRATDAVTEAERDAHREMAKLYQQLICATAPSLRGEGLATQTDQVRFDDLRKAS